MIPGALFADDGRCIVPRVVRTEGRLERMRGLLGRPPLQSGDGLLIDRCSSIHTFGMRYPLDLAFLDDAGLVKKTVAGLQPWRAAFCSGADTVLELAPGSLDTLAIGPGTALRWHGGA